MARWSTWCSANSVTPDSTSTRRQIAGRDLRNVTLSRNASATASHSQFVLIVVSINSMNA